MSLSFFMIRDRKILDWWIPGVYYSTAPCLIPALSYSLLKLARGGGYKYSVFSFLLSMGLIFTASRANMLAVGILFLFYLSLKYYLNRNVIMSFGVLLGSLFLGFSVSLLLLGDTTEGSLAVKNLHKLSYFNEFLSDDFRFLFFGWGAGSYFYTLGFNDYTNLTELSFYETVRRFGLVSSFVIFLTLYFIPIVKANFRSCSPDTVFISSSILIYLMVASTNPFLLGSIGFIALMFLLTLLERNSSNSC